MNSLLLLSIAGLFSGLSKITNKKLALKGHLATSYTAVTMLFSAVLSIPLLFYQFYYSHSLNYWLLILISVIAFALSTFFSFKAYKLVDVSIVSIIQRLNTVMVALIGIVFLHEQYTTQKYIGLLLIFLGSVVVVLKKNKKLNFTTGIIFALLMALTGAVASVLDKIILNDFSPYTYVFVNNLLIGLFFAFNKQTFKDSTVLLKNHFKLIFTSSFLNTSAFVIVMIVLQQTNVSQTMPVFKGFALLVPVVLGITFLKEKEQLIQKIIGVLLGLVGIFLLY